MARGIAQGEEILSDDFTVVVRAVGSSEARSQNSRQRCVTLDFGAFTANPGDSLDKEQTFAQLRSCSEETLIPFDTIAACKGISNNVYTFIYIHIHSCTTNFRNDTIPLMSPLPIPPPSNPRCDSNCRQRHVADLPRDRCTLGTRTRRGHRGGVNGFWRMRPGALLVGGSLWGSTGFRDAGSAAVGAASVCHRAKLGTWAHQRRWHFAVRLVQ